MRRFPAHVLDTARCLHERGFAFASEFGKEFARAYIQHMGADIAKRKKERIAGDVEQYGMPQTGSSPWLTQLRRQWHALVAELAQHAGVDPLQLQLLFDNKSAVAPAAAASTAATASTAAPVTAASTAASTTASTAAAATFATVVPTATASSASAAVAAPHGTDEAKPQLHVQDEKLLIAGRQKGEQAPHFDRDDTASKLKQVYTIILYLTDGVDSTAFPQFPLDDFALPEFDERQEVHNAAAMRATVERGCLQKERYDRWPVRIGDMALFTQATMVRQQCTAV
jgi:hypothetical protein